MTLDVTRRGLLINAAKIIGTGTILSAMPKGVLAHALGGPDVYDVVCVMARDAIKYRDDFVARYGDTAFDLRLLPRPVLYEHLQQICAKQDKIFDYMLENIPYEINDELRKQARLLFDYPREFAKNGDVWQNEPRVIFGTLFCMGIAKELIAIHKLPVDPYRMPAFERFANIYKPLIMA